MATLSDELHAFIKHAEDDIVKVRRDHLTYLHKTALALESELKKATDEMRCRTESINAVIVTLRHIIEIGNLDLFKRALVALWAYDLDLDQS